MAKQFWQWWDYFNKCRWISDFSDPSDQNFVPWLVPSKTWLLLCQKVRFWVGPFKNVAFLVPEWLQSHCFITPLPKKKQKRRDSLTAFDRVFCVKISIHHNKVTFLLSSEVMWNGLVLAFVYSFGISEWMNITGTIIGTNAASIKNPILRRGTVLIAKSPWAAGWMVVLKLSHLTWADWKPVDRIENYLIGQFQNNHAS